MSKKNEKLFISYFRISLSNEFGSLLDFVLFLDSKTQLLQFGAVLFLFSYFSLI